MSSPVPLPSAGSTSWMPWATQLDGLQRATQWAADPEAMFVGTITRNASGAPTASAVVWPDGSPCTYAGTVGPSGGVDTYTVTYGSPVSKTYTQPTVTRDANGNVTV